MIVLDQIDSLRFKQPALKPMKALHQKQRQLMRVATKAKRKSIATIRRQYFLSSALTDAKRAIRLNEDIALASIFTVAVLGFAAISIIANTVFVFMLTAQMVSDVIGASMILLAFLALGVITVLAGWFIALLQNALSIALWDGMVHKKNRSLVTTFRKALQFASRTASAWVAVLIAAFAPVAGAMITAFTVVSLANIPFETSMPYLAVLVSAGIAWIVWAFMSLTMVPYVMLFENVSQWSVAFRRSHSLVARKGRMFILSFYLVLLVAIGGVHFASQGIEKLTGADYTLTLWLLSLNVAFFGNTILTTFYRKRKYARK